MFIKRNDNGKSNEALDNINAKVIFCGRKSLFVKLKATCEELYSNIT